MLKNRRASHQTVNQPDAVTCRSKCPGVGASVTSPTPGSSPTPRELRSSCKRSANTVLLVKEADKVQCKHTVTRPCRVDQPTVHLLAVANQSHQVQTSTTSIPSFKVQFDIRNRNPSTSQQNGFRTTCRYVCVIAPRHVQSFPGVMHRSQADHS